MAVIRSATVEDLPAINAIYNHYVATSTATYQLEPTSEADRLRWFAQLGDRYPVLVAAASNSDVIGWAALTPFHEREAYRPTVTNAVYVRHDQHRCGVGRLLLEAIMARGREAGFHSIVALIDSQQQPSLALHEACGFTVVGQLREAGRKFERWLDVIYLQRML